MKKELIICIGIMILIIIGNIITQNYTKECVSHMNEKLYNLKEASINENKSNVNCEIKEIEEKWKVVKQKLSYYLEHDELEKVETQIFNMKGLYEIEQYREIVPEIEKCVYILEHIRDKTTLNIKNIF